MKLIPLLLSVFLITPHLVTTEHFGEFEVKVKVYGKGNATISLINYTGNLKELYVEGEPLKDEVKIKLKGYEEIEISGNMPGGGEVVLGISQGESIRAGEEIKILVKEGSWKGEILGASLLIASVALTYFLRRWAS